MKPSLQSLLDLANAHHSDSTPIDFSIELFRDIPLAEREEFFRQLVEQTQLVDRSSDEKDELVQAYLNLSKDFEA